MCLCDTSHLQIDDRVNYIPQRVEREHEQRRDYRHPYRTQEHTVLLSTAKNVGDRQNNFPRQSTVTNLQDVVQENVDGITRLY